MVANQAQQIDEDASGAPQCPQCFAHYTQKSADGSGYTCPSGCEGKLVPKGRRTSGKQFRTVRGGTFVLM
ncbi:MAG: hypothetical protein Q7S96_03280 [bacterium]|nr:hypothetical protein [bacterium]